MQIIKREELPEQRQVRLTIAVDKDTWQASLAKCYQGVKSVCPVAGEPTRENLEQAYGPEFLYQEAVNDTYPQALVEAISQSDIQIAGTPTLSVETIGPDGYTFAAVIDLYPEVELGQYKGLSAVYPQVELSNDDTEAALDEYARANPDVQHPERAAMGDEVTLDFEGFVDGVPFEGGKGETYSLAIGSHSFIDNFEEQLIGKNAGEEVEVNVTFPEEYQAKELAGKPAVFKVSIKEVKEKQLPELDDEFASEVSEEAETLEDYKAEVKAKIKERKENEGKEKKENQAVEQAVANAEIDLPAPMVDLQAKQMADDFARRIMQQGMSVEQYFQFTGLNEEKMMEELKPQAEKRIRTRLVLEAIVAAENIEVSDERLA